jgi:hypothetical protein
MLKRLRRTRGVSSPRTQPQANPYADSEEEALDQGERGFTETRRPEEEEEILEGEENVAEERTGRLKGSKAKGKKFIVSAGVISFINVM